LHGNFNAPVEEGIRVLDAGCGPGIWTLEMANDFPNSNFIGTDILEIFPEIDEIPSNCTLLKADTLWPVVVQELVRVIKLGGWIESLEFSDLERPPQTDNFWE